MWNDAEILYDLALNYPIENMNFTDTNYHWKNQVGWIFDTWWDEILLHQKWKFWEKEPKKLKNITSLDFMTTFHNAALKIETSLKLQRCLSRLWKLETSMLKPSLQIKYYNRQQCIIRPEKNGFVVQTLFFLLFAKQHFIIFCYKTWTLWSQEINEAILKQSKMPR